MASGICLTGSQSGRRPLSIVRELAGAIGVRLPGKPPLVSPRLGSTEQAEPVDDLPRSR